jgi:dTDP-glucose pyrophosphorylase
MSKKDVLKDLVVEKNQTIKVAIEVLEKNRRAIAVVLDAGKVLGTITDGDIRRGIINNISLDEECSSIVNKEPLLANMDDDRKDLQDLCKKRNIEAIPIINQQKELIDLYVHEKGRLLNRKILEQKDDFCAFILAGGEGKRLRPLTIKKPKPLINIGSTTLLKNNIELIKGCGIKDIFISVNYLADQIIEEIGDGKEQNVRISYLKEKKKLGTAAPLGLLNRTNFSDILVINADIVTSLSLDKLLDHHKRNKSDVMIAITERNTEIPFGVVEINDKEKVIGIEEKPNLKHFCAAGIYVMSKNILKEISAENYLDMPEFINSLVAKKFKVDVFPLFPSIETWRDIGTKESLDKFIKNE